MGKLQDRLEVHRRELSVLEQKLGQKQMMYYPDPNKGLLQESGPTAMSDVHKLQARITQKKADIAADQQAVSDLREQLRREGGTPGGFAKDRRYARREKMTKLCALPFLMLLASLPLPASPQESLGDVARQVRQEEHKAGTKPAKVYTNDNLPGSKRHEHGQAAPGVSATPVAASPDQAPAGGEASEAPKPASQAPEALPSAAPTDKREYKRGTKEYWQARFRSARARLAAAEERQQLDEDELNLLQLQETRALDPDLKTELAGKINAKQDALSRRRAATEEARAAFEDLQKEFLASHAPEEWSREPESSQ